MKIWTSSFSRKYIFNNLCFRWIIIFIKEEVRRGEFSVLWVSSSGSNSMLKFKFLPITFYVLSTWALGRLQLKIFYGIFSNPSIDISLGVDNNTSVSVFLCTTQTIVNSMKLAATFILLIELPIVAAFILYYKKNVVCIKLN